MSRPFGGVPPTVRAVVYSPSGSSSVPSLVERDPAEPGAGQVRVRVAVSGVNPTDWKARAGGTRRGDFAEVVPNQDGAGTVDRVGEGVTDLAVGDRGWLYLAQHEQAGRTGGGDTVLPARRGGSLPPRP